MFGKLEHSRRVSSLAMKVTLKVTLASALVSALLSTGCAPAVRLGLQPFYVPAALDTDSAVVRKNLAYRADASADAEKHRLDLYHPKQPGWPLMVFIHGGSLAKGDKDLTLGGYDIYGNLGRFYTARGIGVAVVNYRLQPEVRWPDQIDDVATAVAWVRRHVLSQGGDGRVFLAGHSAGAWLAARLALDVELLARVGLKPADLSGVISVSGSGYDMRDEKTWRMYGREGWWAKRFDPGNPNLDWRIAASVVPLLEGNPPADAPPFLLMHTTREWPALGRQNLLFHQALKRVGVESELVTVTTDGHRRMVLAMSRAEKIVSEKILQLVASVPMDVENRVRDRQFEGAGGE